MSQRVPRLAGPGRVMGQHCPELSQGRYWRGVGVGREISPRPGPRAECQTQSGRKRLLPVAMDTWRRHQMLLFLACGAHLLVAS